MFTKRHLAVLAGLAVIWCLLSGHYVSLLLFLGALSCLLSGGLYQKIANHTKLTRISCHPLQQFSYTCWLIAEIIKSSVNVIGAIFNVRKLSPQIFDVAVGDLDELGRVIYANSITRTPGTVSIQVSETKIRVHALMANSKDGLLDDAMLSKVRQLHQRASER